MGACRPLTPPLNSAAFDVAERAIYVNRRPFAKAAQEAMPLSTFFRRRSAEPMPAEALYLDLVRQARRPVFYAEFGVPDTLDGRFDTIVLHVALVLLRLRAEGPAGAALGQALFDVLFADMDRSLREMGVGDLGVGKRVKQIGKAVYGRLAAYDEGLAASDGKLEAALRRNLYGTVSPEPTQVAAMVRYARAAATHLAVQPLAGFNAGKAEFPEPESR
jgi:cytochrome b pre-mRNA-processing protein 3